jgi:hypothetical protein
MIDDRLLAYWERESEARARLRNQLPASWRNDPRPNMDVVRELYIEAMLRLKEPAAATPVAIGDDDR